MKKLLAILSLAFLIPAVSCDELGIFDSPAGLSDEEVIAGLRSALEHGTDTAVSRLSLTDGYFGDELIKILLPEEAQPVYDVIDKLPTNLVDNTILAINRAAEDAAVEAKPIFVDAITSLTIADGKEILFGTDTAATHYLRENTENALYDAFKPKIETSLSKDLVLGISAENSYSTLINAYNLGSLGGLLYEQIKTNSLSEHVTRRALKGLFVKVGDEEKLIREDPAHRVTEILEKVFAEQDFLQ